MPSDPLRIAVLASGRGSNLQALIDAIAGGTLDARDRRRVFRSRAMRRRCSARVAPGSRRMRSSRASIRATRAGVRRGTRSTRIAALAPDLIVCAGYLRLISERCGRKRFRGRLVNIHPSLLPAFKGLRTHAQALPAGVDASMAPACIS